MVQSQSERVRLFREAQITAGSSNGVFVYHPGYWPKGTALLEKHMKEFVVKIDNTKNSSKYRCAA